MRVGLTSSVLGQRSRRPDVATLQAIPGSFLSCFLLELNPHALPGEGGRDGACREARPCQRRPHQQGTGSGSDGTSGSEQRIRDWRRVVEISGRVSFPIPRVRKGQDATQKSQFVSWDVAPLRLEAEDGPMRLG